MKIIESKKRFIADANCPQCHAKDTLRLWHHQEVNAENEIIYHTEIVECVECSHQQVQVEKDSRKEEVIAKNLIGKFNINE